MPRCLGPDSVILSPVSITLVTGATGLVGHAIVQSLLARKRNVRVLARSPEKARRLLPGCAVAAGDVTDRDSLRKALDAVDVVYHAAGLPEQWLPDPASFERVNYGGTRNLVEASMSASVRRFVYTSTIDVFEARAGEEFDETALDPLTKATPYERSKQAADREVARSLERGLSAIFLHPAAVYGPGPAGSPGLNDFVRRLMKKQLPALPPGGLPVVYAEDVGEAHVRAEERAEVGARFILCERFVTTAALAREAARLIGTRPPRVLPLAIARAAALATEALSRVTKRPPLVPAGQLHFLQWGARPNSSRARRELDLELTPLSVGLARLVDSLRSESF
jgi:dihydroflavonol-4-reductase